MKILRTHLYPIQLMRISNILICKKKIYHWPRFDNHRSWDICVHWKKRWLSCSTTKVDTTSSVLLTNVERKAPLCSSETWMESSASQHTPSYISEVSWLIVEEWLTHQKAAPGSKKSCKQQSQVPNFTNPNSRKKSLLFRSMLSQ